MNSKLLALECALEEMVEPESELWLAIGYFWQPKRVKPLEL